MMIIRDMLIQSGVFILLLAALRPAFKRFLSARVRYALWLIPALRLILPFSIPSALSLWGWMAPAAPRPAAFQAAAPAAALPIMRAAPAPLSPLPLPPAPVNQTAPVQAASGIDWGIALPQMMVWAWVVVAAGLMVYVIVSNLRLKNKTRGMQPFYAPDVPLPLYVAEGLASPCLAGLLRPRIMLNRRALQTETLLNMVLTHELAHWRRKDHLWAALRSLLLCLWWWNPLVWLMAALSREDSEAACDEAVTLHMDAPRREAYGMSLIALMQPRHPAWLLTADTAMSSGKRQMKERITMIADQKKKRRAAGLCLVIVLTLLVPMLFTTALGQSAPSPADAARAKTGEMTAEDAIAIAEEAVMARVGYDFGIHSFKDAEAVLEDRAWAGETQKTWVVSLGVVTGRYLEMLERLEVHVLAASRTAVEIDKGLEILWQNTLHFPEIPRDLNRRAWVMNPEGGAVDMISVPYGGNWPSEILFNGSPVTLNRVTPGVGVTGMRNGRISPWAIQKIPRVPQAM